VIRHARSDLPAGTVTFLFTDVEGSTRLLHELGAEAYDDALMEQRRALREAFTRHGGVEVDTQGDAFFYAFPTAEGALLAAGEGQAALAEGPIAVRMGLHTGTPHLGKEGYIGGDVHLGARIAAAAHGGQVVLSVQTRERVGANITDLGEHRFKDIEAAVPIFQLGDGSFPPLKTISNTNLPRPASSFVGREREVSKVVAQLRDGARLLTLSGPGGTGKTRLAIEAASELVPDFKAGVFWVGLAALRDTSLVTETIAQTLGAKDGLAEHIAERELLLLLDNLEQVIECALELASLLEDCSNLRLLVTSRELLRVRGEVAFAVPPLLEEDAISLFCERSQLEPEETIAELCRRLDDLPLAVELAAARTSVLTPQQILDRLSQRLDVLKGGRDADPRQQTLRATIEWSYSLLSPDEQQLFSRLSVFAGGCTLEAAEDVADADLDTLQSLVEKSLLRFTDGRYWMLETIREYARERLEEADAARQFERQHADHALLLGTRAHDRALGGDPEGGYGELEREHDNVRVALATFARDRSSSEELSLICAVAPFWLTRGHYHEGHRWVAAALEWADSPLALRAQALGYASDFARLTGERALATTYAEQALAAALELGEPRALASALHELAESMQAEGDYERAEELYEQSVVAARQAGETGAGSIGSLGDLALARGDFEAAAAYSRQAIELERNSTAKISPLVGTFNLASALFHLGEIREARELLQEALTGFSERGYTEGVGWCLLGVAAVLGREGRSDDAARLVGAAERILNEIGVGVAPSERRLRDAAIADDREPTQMYYAQGRSLERDDAVSLALAALD
jgi:predicted ATPase/class 3 adenylate cyclase